MNELFPALHWSNLLIIPGMLLAYTVHELGHALAAYFLGDYSQVEREKITLNPLEHISWLGAIAFLLFGIGWPKGLQANPYNFKRRHLDLLLVALAGPAASLTLALLGLLITLMVAAGSVYGSGASTDQVFRFLFPNPINLLQPSETVRALTIAATGYIAMPSFWLMFMSLLPLPGQDGLVAILSLIGLFRERNALRPVQSGQVRSHAARPTLMGQQKRRNNAADTHFKIGVQYHEENQIDDAIARYRQAIGNDQKFGPAYINMGLAYLVKNDRKKAIQAFRGAIQHADDDKSKMEAWRQLHLLSEVSPVDEDEARTSMTELGATPWTDTKPHPNWLGLGLGVSVLVVGAVALYGYLLSQLFELLKT